MTAHNNIALHVRDVYILYLFDTATINFAATSMQLVIEGGSYSRVATIALICASTHTIYINLH